MLIHLESAGAQPGAMMLNLISNVDRRSIPVLVGIFLDGPDPKLGVEIIYWLNGNYQD